MRAIVKGSWVWVVAALVLSLANLGAEADLRLVDIAEPMDFSVRKSKNARSFQDAWRISTTSG